MHVVEQQQQQQQEAGPTPLNWRLIIFRWMLLFVLLICVFLNIYSSVYHVEMITHYMLCGECTFVVYEGLVLGATFEVIVVLLIGFGFTFMQMVRALRVYNMVFFLSAWLKMLMTLVLTQRYPITHDVHYKWMQNKSLEFYEKTYDCCGVLGPDDYLLTSGELPRSCFYNDSTLTKDLHYMGCMNKDVVSETLIRYELLNSLFELILVICMIVYYLYLKKIAAPVRTLGDLWRARIFL